MRKHNREEIALMWALGAGLAAGLWLLLLIAKGFGAVGISWDAVLLGLVWIPVGLMLVAAYLTIAPLIADAIARRIRARAKDNRIRAQAKKLGVWGRPEALGGRALELYARDLCGLQRRRNETDMALRARVLKARKEAAR